MPNLRLLISICALSLTLLSGVAGAQAYPTKPVRIVTSEPGGANDFIARLIAPRLTSSK
ncbi:MAG: hypothetical protein ACXWCY_28495 [Burkholderiales bacterium]